MLSQAVGCERLCDVFQFCSPTLLQSGPTTNFRKNSLSGTVKFVEHYINYAPRYNNEYIHVPPLLIYQCF
ncbi:hypothetical protein FXB78_09335 [Aggregatibacter actinomycetemcomitans]|nr:hypothetical protein FXB81_09365 [Aggregatibacter actinomycetemcomitans]TYB28209.1 hypothetical protein FXB78_09335 [Aggregatibacter actinomycetemcomitans]